MEWVNHIRSRVGPLRGQKVALRRLLIIVADVLVCRDVQGLNLSSCVRHGLLGALATRHHLVDLTVLGDITEASHR